jgi:N-acetylmuramoyl-L-alanine amidase
MFVFSPQIENIMKCYSTVVIVMAVLVFYISCAPNPYRITNKEYKKQVRSLSKIIRQYPVHSIESDSISKPPYFVGTTNLNLRKPNFVIIHHTAQKDCPQTLHTFTIRRTQVSAHYVICKDGTVYQMLNDYLRAWHAGVSKWGNVTDVNSSSIGIELDNNGFEPFTEKQIQNLLAVLDTLKRRHNIPVANFIGHADIAPTRKNDPNVFFPWKQLADRGFGNWYDDTTGVILPETFNHLQALRIIGYDIKDTTAAILAFKRHFVQDTIPVFGEADKKVLYTLCKKYM